MPWETAIVRLVVTALGVTLAASCSLTGQRMQTDWWPAGALDGTRLTITAFTDGSSCTSFDDVEVTEARDHVRVEAFVRRRTAAGCTDDFTTRDVTIELQAPLGNRAIVGCVPPPTGLRARALQHDDVVCAERSGP